MNRKENIMKARRIAVLALIALVLPLGVAQAATTNCNPAVDLFGCIVSGSGSVGLQVENSWVGGTALAGLTSGDGITIGVFGQADSDSGHGVRGLATTDGTGVSGRSDSGTGVSGRSDSGTGVDGYSLESNGVFGDSGGIGSGVVGRSLRGFAMEARGHTFQSLTSGGWVKALVRMQGSTLSRCYNSQSPSNPTNCNLFTIAGGAGNYTITFPFQVNNRYVVVTAESVADSPRCCMIQYDFPASNQVRVRTWDHNGIAIDRAFSLVVF
jgi:hypothetical protein